ncbi:MAG TPA: bifunctional phosphoribosyl-AMP cyclohydrolase/phosphoribosyl-ATP diphosphatase HisIE [Sphaerochaeta sp.]|nr:bifunctional phosphoribosyl-AMP cyclohydrolase/phosphoribosyl-ATP diphosphatase HisIE [Sphaerochaeta sp.]HOR80626.1 bifunctional phosphoribosyl-AMP cyclohydrolase/phosphoribosyl-ATP diphosphatase HisIE [Sphaerochaeta sp.]HPK64579.1 bifunctional phosphoribosyl-AMP cyclohydrolase/phosphoribosyl-ATP diphosphatase HisIE [Sphaerochaeta sp.]HPY45505.1 bifunctional phosphoribosyl-AMP cyclohydrolase/phosphoribosyl-ATP diphosphatase HisIE [Sphaerochaeta sp.]HQB05110.1 bifunctional phosphoribosyl-AMP 
MQSMAVSFEKMGGLVPAVVQDAVTRRVLMLGFMNEEALKTTRDRGLVTFWSRSRETLWTKGETSGNYLEVRDIIEDCDNDTLLIKAVPTGPVCHTGKDTCFGEVNNPEEVSAPEFLFYLQEVIRERREFPLEGSYTNHLFSRGLNKIAQKVGEEAVELIIEAKDDNKQLFLGEAADLIYHFLVLLTQKEVGLEEVIEVLKLRHSR